MKYLTQWMVAIAFASAAFSLPVYGGSEQLQAHGAGGGSSFSLSCGDGKVLIGLKGKTGGWLGGQIQGKCRKISTDGKWLDSTTNTDASDGGGPFVGAIDFNITCPVNTAVKGMSGRFLNGTFLTKLNLRCEGLGAPNTSATTISVGAGGDQSWALESCSDSKPGRGLHGKSEVGGLTSIGLTCHTGTTPDMEVLAPPNGITAINLLSPTGPATSAITPFIQLQWMDRSTYETGFRITITNLSNAGGQTTINRPAASGIDSLQAVNITDLPGGDHTATVCSLFSADNGSIICGITPFFHFFTSLAPTCNPAITSLVERIGAGTARVRWSHTCTNPTNFTIRLRSGSNPIGTVASTPDGTARDETFNFVVGTNSGVQVCAIFPGQSATGFCSTQQTFQFN